MQITGPRLAMRLLAILMMALLPSAAGRARAQEPYFPERIFLPDDAEGNSVADDMTSVHLKAMKEPSLWALSRKDREATAYRFLWLHPDKPQVCMRLGRADGAFVLHVAGHDGTPGPATGKLTIGKDIKLTDRQGERLVGLIEETKFWTSPAVVKETRNILDGDGILIEGAKGGEYRVIIRAGQTTGEGCKAFCRSLLELADEPGLLEEWDRYRKEERESSDYLPEPPQTEDRGDPI